MKSKHLKYVLAIAAAVALASCGGSISKNNSVIPVTGISTAVVYSFDLGTVDPATHKYYVTDRTNKSIDVVQNGALIGQFKQSFAGCNSTFGTTTAAPVALPGCTTIAPSFTTNNDASGPDGLDVVGAYLYVGDVNNLWVLDKNTGAKVQKIAIPSAPTGLRADEGCWDSVNNIYAIATPAADNPFMSFFDTTVPGAPTLIATVYMNDSANAASGGLEACFSDGVNFYGNNDGSTANPHGEVWRIPAASIVALKATAPQVRVQAGTATFNDPTGTAITPAVLAGVLTPFALPAQCDPTGIAAGPAAEGSLGSMCRPGKIGTSMDFQIMNKTTGAIIQTVVGAGGGDQITYDATSNRWFLADSRQTADSKSCGGGSASCVLTPKLGIVDGTTHAIVNMLPNGNNSHSVAVDSALGIVYTPFTNASATGGGTGFNDGGINTYSTR
jgi:hypothetical protein